MSMMYQLYEANRALLQTVYRSVQNYCIPVKQPERPVLIQLLSRIGRAVDADAVACACSLASAASSEFPQITVSDRTRRA